MRQFTRALALLMLGAVAVTAGTKSPAPTPAPQTKEQEMVNSFINRTETKHKKKLGFISGYYAVDRINKKNDYNSFVTYQNQYLGGGKLSELGTASAIGLSFGMHINPKMAWNIGGEYWMKFGDNIPGTFTYAPPSGTVPINNIQSELKVVGFNVGLTYYLVNPPTYTNQLQNVAVRTGFTAGYYSVSWDVFQQVENLNLATAAPAGTNATFKGSTPSFAGHLGIDYPVKFGNLVLGFDGSYQVMNFSNVAWYNSQDQEIVASYSGTSDGRVDLQLSGFRGRIELKRYFGW
jgi:hypothetical protein